MKFSLGFTVRRSGERRPFRRQQLRRSPPRLLVGSICSSYILHGIVWSRRGYTPTDCASREGLRISFGSRRTSRGESALVRGCIGPRMLSLPAKHHCASFDKRDAVTTPELESVLEEQAREAASRENYLNRKILRDKTTMVWGTLNMRDLDRRNRCAW